MSFNESDYIDWEDYMDDLRKHKFKEGYKPKHPILFDYYYMDDNQKEEFMKTYINLDMYWAEKNKEWNYVIEEPIWEVYQFPLITEELSKMIVEEVEHFGIFLGNDNGPNRETPYSTTDVGFNSIPGTKNYKDKPLSKFYYDIQQRYTKPIIEHVWKHKAKFFPPSWVVKYEPGGQDFLKPHYDASVCASIVSLNSEYKGGGTWFERQKAVVDREPGWCTIHPSQLTHRHAGKRVTKGKRYILVTFID